MASLSVKRIAALKAPGLYCDGDGLNLRIGPTGAKSWILRVTVHGRRRSMGLGSVSLVPLAEARDKARELRKVARLGGDPFASRQRESLTFEAAARRVHANLLPTWKNEGHGREWLSSLERYAFPLIGSRPVGGIQPQDVLAVLSPIWTDKHETAARVRQRLRSVFDWAKGAGHYEGENPVEGIKKALPVVKRRPAHMEAMPWQDVPAFVAELRERQGMSARTLEFIILTAVRSGEARGARWAEFDGDIWTVPAERMKRGLPHRVPLSAPALAVLERVRGMGSELVFPSAGVRKGKGGPSEVAQSVNVFRPLLRRMGCEGLTVHGFRSSFRDWASESAHAPREVAEAALSHAVGDEVEQAYARSDLLERRRVLMDRWGAFVSDSSGAVVRLHG
ncbi:MAG: tyrosine-type recombinase/integrase [Hasllibacter sp.]